MDNLEHSFPLPETETHKLDEVKEVLDHAQEQVPASLQGFVQASPWLSVALAVAGGLCLGAWLGSGD